MLTLATFSHSSFPFLPSRSVKVTSRIIMFRHGVFGTLELSHGSLKRHNALLAAGASNTLKRNVCKQRTCVAIR